MKQPLIVKRCVTVIEMEDGSMRVIEHKRPTVVHEHHYEPYEWRSSDTIFGWRENDRYYQSTTTITSYGMVMQHIRDWGDFAPQWDNPEPEIMPPARRLNP